VIVQVAKVAAYSIVDFVRCSKPYYSSDKSHLKSAPAV